MKERTLDQRVNSFVGLLFLGIGVFIGGIISYLLSPVWTIPFGFAFCLLAWLGIVYIIRYHV